MFPNCNEDFPWQVKAPGKEAVKNNSAFPVPPGAGARQEKTVATIRVISFDARENLLFYLTPFHRDILSSY